MTRKVSKLDASRVLEVSPSTIDRRIERGELQIEHEPRGNSYKVWVLLDDEVNDVLPAEVPGIAGVPGAPPNTPNRFHGNKAAETRGPAPAGTGGVPKGGTQRKRETLP